MTGYRSIRRGIRHAPGHGLPNRQMLSFSGSRSDGSKHRRNRKGNHASPRESSAGWTFIRRQLAVAMATAGLVVGLSATPGMASAAEAAATSPGRAVSATSLADLKIVPDVDLVPRDFTADAPGQKMVGDITYIPTWQGWLYLATVIDCHNKEVIGWATGDNYKTPLIEQAIEMAARNHSLAGNAFSFRSRQQLYISAVCRDAEKI